MSGIACPRCSALAPDLPSTEIACATCGHRWLRPQTLPMAWMVQRSEGEEPIGPIDRILLREMLYGGSLSGRERLRLPGHQGAWTLITDQPELADVLQLLRVQKTQEARIQGWQRSTTTTSSSAPTPSADADADADAPAPAPGVAAVAPVVVREVVAAAASAAPPAPAGGIRMGLIVAVGVVLALIAIVVLAMNLS